MMRKIAFATNLKFPNLTEDDRTVIDHLERQNIQVQPLVWDRDNLRTYEFESIIIRSCWDYHLKPRDFLKWVKQIEEQKIPLWNPGHIIKNNTDKIYLKQLSEKGVLIPSTVWLEKDSKVDIFAIIAEQDWAKAVIKPTISATAYQTWTTSLNDARAHQYMIETMLKKSGVMVQKFVDEIQTDGEWSFIFFRKEYSHAVLKRAKPGDFRVQKEFGGYLEQASPSEFLIVQAQHIVDSIEEDLLFARVDGVLINNQFQLMELELIEPHLYLQQDLLASQRFAEAIVASL